MAVHASVVLLALLAWTHVAAAQPAFVWDAPSTCPTAAEVQSRIERRLPEGVSVAGIAVTIVRDRGSLVAQIDTHAITVANQIRTLTSVRCDELADAVAVIVARLATEARRRPRAVAPIDGEEPSRSEAPVARAEVVSIVLPRPTKRSPVWGGGVRAMAMSGIGMVPSVGLGSELGGFIRRRASFAELAIARWGDRQVFLATGEPGRADVGLQTVALRGGWASDVMPLRGWVGVELGAMRGTGLGLNDPRAGEGRWTAVSAGFGVAWPMSRWSRFVGTIELAVPVERARFALGDDTEVYQPAAISARCSFGLELGWR